MQLSFGAVGEDDALGDDGDGAWAFVESEIVAIGGGIRVPPLRRAGEGVERFDHLAVVDAMKQNQALPATTGPLRPWPICLRQMTRGPVDGHFSLSGAPTYTPLREGPRNCGQSAAARRLRAV